MLITCPSCKIKFSFDDNRIGPDGVKLRCGKCKTVFKVVRKVQAAVPPSSADGGSSEHVPIGRQVGRVKVVVANESKSFCAAVHKVLAAEPFDVSSFNDGKSALEAITQSRPDVVLLDVALPVMYGFEVCDAVRKNDLLQHVKIILIASIYDKTRYKRAPSSCYGADDYIEKHHIPDALVPMIYRLVGTNDSVASEPAADVSSQQAAAQVTRELPGKEEETVQQAVREELRLDEEKETLVSPAAAADLPEGHIKAKRLARIIVSDILLYNQGKAEEGVRRGNFYDLLADDIREGRALYERRVAPEVRSESSYLDEAFQDVIEKIRRELGI